MAESGAAWGYGRLARDLAIALVGLIIAVSIIGEAVGESETATDPASLGRRLRSDPLDLPALRSLANTLEVSGQTDAADRLYDFIGRRTWRDGPTEVWLLRNRLKAGRYGEAFDAADSLLRRDADGSTRPSLFPVLSEATRFDESRAALIARLRSAPWWRKDFLQTLATRGDLRGALAVFTSLSAGDAPSTPEEYSPLITRLVKNGDYRVAFLAWRSLGHGQSTNAGQPVSFSIPTDHTPFTWSTAEGVGGGSEVDTTAGHPSQATLRIDFDGFSSPRLPATLLVLNPGRYRVSWRERRKGSSAPGITLRLRCADETAASPVAGSALGAETPPETWRTVSKTVEIPAAGCSGQWLEIIASPGERRQPLVVWFADVKVDPI